MTKEELEEKIRAADKAYYTDGSTACSDWEYDQMKLALKQLDPENPLLNSLGEDHTDGLQKIQRSVRMLSLEKIQQNKENPDDYSKLVTWWKSAGSPEVVVESKVDGMSAEVKYVHGKLASVSTRGEGLSGDDITANTKHCFPDFISWFERRDEVNIRGELYISKKEFARINELQRSRGLPVFANARNLCAGTVKSKEFIPDRKISFIAHGFGQVDENYLTELKTFDVLYSRINWAGIKEVPSFSAQTEEDLIKHVKQIGSDEFKDTLPFEIDGAVIKFKNISAYREAGETEHHPKGAIAFKYIPEIKEATVKDIIWQIGGKTGKATPVAIITPTVLSGSLVERVSLANAGQMAFRGVKVGSKIMVEKANEIIPHVVSVLDGESYTLEEEMACPECGALMTLTPGKAEHTADYICPNAECRAKKAALLQQALGVNGLNILGVGPELCYEFVTLHPFINAATFLQLDLDEYPECLSELQKTNLYKEVRAARNAPLWRWISAMSITGVGEGSAKAISKQCKSLVEFVSTVGNKDIPMELTDKRRQACIEYISTKGNVATELMEMSLNPMSDNYIDKLDNPPLEGINFVVTGTFNFGRTELEELIQKNGGSVKGSVSKKTNYVVCGTAPGATKIDKAGTIGVAIISEQEFFKLLKDKNDNQENRAD